MMWRSLLNGMNGPSDRWAELNRLADLRVRFIDETGAYFDAKPSGRRIPRALTPYAWNPSRRSGPVTPEAERFLQNADDHLKRGQTMLTTGLDEDAGRAAYIAAFHAAQAFIF
jgi:hypothetical protein